MRCARLLTLLHRLGYGSRQRRLVALVQSRLPHHANVMRTLQGGGAGGLRRYPWRELDQLKILDRLRPRRIVELGSGASTAVFSAWVQRTPDASLLSVDHSEDWADLTRDALRRAGFLPHPRIDVRVVPMRETASGSSYAMTLEDGIDLLYVDGPPVLMRDGPTANQDAIEHLASGGRPNAIMIDSRLATVEAIRQHPDAADYRFTPGLPWLTNHCPLDVRYLAAFGTYHRHSVFTRISRGAR